MLTVFVLELIDCKRPSLYIFHMKIGNCIPIEVYFCYLVVLNDFLTGIPGSIQNGTQRGADHHNDN